MKDKRILIVGTVRNCEDSLKEDVARLREAFGGAEALHWLLIESDSEDRSVAVLEHLKAEMPGFDFISHGALRERMAGRTERLSFCRNSYVQALRERPNYAEITHVVIADFDGINTHITRSGVESCWSSGIDWDMVAANQAGPYYDVWALRHPLWSPNDCWKHFVFLESFGLSKRQCYLQAVASRMVTIPPERDWIEVDSAFGGLAIYRREMLEGVEYVGIGEDGIEFCEHVHVHAQMQARGARLFINPAMINAGMTQHSNHLSLWFRIAEALKQPVRSVIGRGRLTVVRRVLRRQGPYV